MAKCLLLLLLLPLSAFGRDVVVDWTLATQREDNTTLPVSEIAATRVEWGSCSGTAFGTSAGVRDVAPPALTTTLALGNGTWCLRAFTVDTDGQVSDPTPVIAFTLKGRPKPPVIKSIR
jgi:hypothetical protein